MKTMKKTLVGAMLAVTASLAATGCAADGAEQAGRSEGAMESRDDSAAFQRSLDALKDKKQSEALIEALADYRIVFVPGFYDIAANLGQGKTDQAELYFEDEMQWLEDQGICWSKSEGSTLATPQQNAKLVVDEIDNPHFSKVKALKRFFKGHWSARHCDEKKAIIVSHSRGGIDVLQALLDDPKLSAPDSKIAGWISLQAPFHGSRLASEFSNLLTDDVNKESIAELGRFMQNVKQLEKAGEEVEKQAPNIDLLKQTLKVISVEERAPAMVANAAKLKALSATKLPIIAVGTTQPDLKKVPELLEIPRDYLLKKYGPNDGFLLQGAAKLPGASYVEFEGDHFSTVFFLGGRMTDSSLGRLAEKLLNIAIGSKRPDRVLAFAALLRMNIEAIESRRGGQGNKPR